MTEATLKDYVTEFQQNSLQTDFRKKLEDVKMWLYSDVFKKQKEKFEMLDGLSDTLYLPIGQFIDETSALPNHGFGREELPSDPSELDDPDLNFFD